MAPGKFHNLKEHWLNPFLSHSEIYQKLNISKSTLHRHIKKQNLKSLKVGIFNNHNLPKTLFFRSDPHVLGPCAYYDLQIIKLLAEALKVRFEVQFIEYSQYIEAISLGKVDLMVTSLTNHDFLKEKMLFSHPYAAKVPGAAVLRKKERKFIKHLKIGASSPIKNSEQMFRSNYDINQEAKVKFYAGYEKAFYALLGDKVDLLYIQPLLVDHLLRLHPEIEVTNDFYPVPGNTCVAVAPKNYKLLSTINVVIEEWHERDMLARLESRCNSLIVESFEHSQVFHSDLSRLNLIRP